MRIHYMLSVIWIAALKILCFNFSLGEGKKNYEFYRLLYSLISECYSGRNVLLLVHHKMNDESNRILNVCL